VLGLAALALTIWVDVAGSPLPGDLWLTHRIQDLDALRRNEGIINGFGYAPLQLGLLFAFGLLCAFGHRLGVRAGSETQRVGAIVACVAALVLRDGSELLKRLVESPRPTEAFGVEINRHFDSWGFPSGHVYGDVLVYGVIAFLAAVALGKRAALVARVGCAIVIVLSGPARVVIGAHWPSDTAGGYLWGGTAMCLALWAGKTAERGR
jgi:undecaprenyl-diphosphatase